MFPADLLPLVLMTLIIGYTDHEHNYLSAETKFAMAITSIIPLSYYIGMGIARYILLAFVSLVSNDNEIRIYRQNSHLYSHRIQTCVNTKGDILENTLNCILKDKINVCFINNCICPHSFSAQSNFAVGAVVNATFGSITEMTFYITALLQGQRAGTKCYEEIVKAALTGTLLGCILFIPVSV